MTSVVLTSSSPVSLSSMLTLFFCLRNSSFSKLFLSFVYTALLNLSILTIFLVFQSTKDIKISSYKYGSLHYGRLLNKKKSWRRLDDDNRDKLKKFLSQMYLRCFDLSREVANNMRWETQKETDTPLLFLFVIKTYLYIKMLFTKQTTDKYIECNDAIKMYTHFVLFNNIKPLNN